MGVDIPEAAVRLGISVDAVRKRISRGKLQATKTDAGWAVILPDRKPEVDRPDRLADTVETRPDIDGLVLLERIRGLETTLSELEHSVQLLQTQLADSRQLVSSLQDELSVRREAEMRLHSIMMAMTKPQLEDRQRTSLWDRLFHRSKV